MPIDERRRSALFEAAARVLGEDHAMTMFELLPPPKTDLATRADLDLLEERLDQLEAGMRTEMALLREELLSAFRGELVSAIAGQTRGIVVAIMAAIIAAVIGIGGLAVTLSQLL